MQHHAEQRTAMGGRRNCLIVLLSLLPLLFACASQPPARFTGESTAEDLLSGVRFGVAADARVADPELLAVDQPMRNFLEQVLTQPLTESQRINRILHAVLEDGLQLEYENLLTLSARAAFPPRARNCMSFTNLLVALAREAGLDARYQEVLVPATWTESEGTWYYNLHVNVLLNLREGKRVIDFNPGEYTDGYPRTAISDATALARYYNNLGVHWMTEAEPSRAFLYFREALWLEPDSAHVWTNLGTLYRREGHLAEAESAYRRAFADASNPVAASQLARLYRAHGDSHRAQWYASRAQRLREQNPYYQFHLAEQAYAAGDDAAAEAHLQRALRKHLFDYRFHRLMAQVQWRRGDAELAEAYLRSAHALAADAHKPVLARKLALLTDAG